MTNILRLNIDPGNFGDSYWKPILWKVSDCQYFGKAQQKTDLFSS